MAKCEVEFMPDGQWRWYADDRCVSASLFISSLGIQRGQRVEITRRNTALDEAARKLALVANGLLSNTAFIHDWPRSAERMKENTKFIISALPPEPEPENTPEPVSLTKAQAAIVRESFDELLKSLVEAGK